MNPSPLTDETPMPFGKWRGTEMRHVPAEYLQWCEQNLTGKWQKPILDYIAAYCERTEIDKDMPLSMATLRHKTPPGTPVCVRSDTREAFVRVEKAPKKQAEQIQVSPPLSVNTKSAEDALAGLRALRESLK